MPVFNRGANSNERRRQEALRTLTGQVQSLTFVERGAPRPKLGSEVSPLGELLTSATNSLMFPGVTKRTIPRLLIGSASGREYHQQIATSGGQGSLGLAFNPALRLHRELMAPPQDATYHVAAFQAPPIMNGVVGVYDHISSEAVTLAVEDQPMMSVTMLDNFGAEALEARFFQSTSLLTSSGGVNAYHMSLIGPEQEALEVGDGTSWTDASLQAGVVIDVDSNGDEVSLRAGGLAARPASGADYDILFLLHVPGESGGYGVAQAGGNSPNISGEISLAANDGLAKRIVDAVAPAIYLGVYVTPTSNLLFRA